MNSGAYVNNAGVFLVQTLFGFYILAVMLRFLLQWVRADFYNPLVQFLVKITNPPLLPMRRLIPGYLGVDMAAVVLMLGLQVIELTLVFLLNNQSVQFGGVLLVAFAELLNLLLNVLFWTVIIQAILSWVNPDPSHPVVTLLYQLTEPVLRPARGVLPPISGIDLSPILVLIALQLLKIILVAPLRDMGIRFMVGG
jgi:YggT family protein